MGARVMQSIQDNSPVDDPTALAIMLAIGRVADDETGIAGEKDAPSIDEIASRARCHRNTVLKWLPKLEEGEALVIDRTGYGRGTKTVFAVLVPLGNYDNGTPDIPKEGGNGTSELREMVQNLTVMVHQLSETVKTLMEMAQNRRELVQETVQDLVQNGTPGVPKSPLNTKNNTTTLLLCAHFENETGLFQPNDSTDKWGDEWQRPLDGILKHCQGDTVRAKLLITQAIQESRVGNNGRRYFIASPMSIYAKALNLPSTSEPSRPDLWTAEMLPYLQGKTTFTALSAPTQSAIRQMGGDRIKQQETGRIQQQFIAIIRGN